MRCVRYSLQNYIQMHGQQNRCFFSFEPPERLRNRLSYLCVGHMLTFLSNTNRLLLMLRTHRHLQPSIRTSLVIPPRQHVFVTCIATTLSLRILTFCWPCISVINQLDGPGRRRPKEDENYWLLGEGRGQAGMEWKCWTDQDPPRVVQSIEEEEEEEEGKEE